MLNELIMIVDTALPQLVTNKFVRVYVRKLGDSHITDIDIAADKDDNLYIVRMDEQTGVVTAGIILMKMQDGYSYYRNSLAIAKKSIGL